jgi:hypothetical protein
MIRALQTAASVFWFHNKFSQPLISDMLTLFRLNYGIGCYYNTDAETDVGVKACPEFDTIIRYVAITIILYQGGFVASLKTA